MIFHFCRTRISYSSFRYYKLTGSCVFLIKSKSCLAFTFTISVYINTFWVRTSTFVRRVCIKGKNNKVSIVCEARNFLFFCLSWGASIDSNTCSSSVARLAGVLDITVLTNASNWWGIVNVSLSHKTMCTTFSVGCDKDILILKII